MSEKVEKAEKEEVQVGGGKGADANKITFSGFVVGLASQAVSFLGLGGPEKSDESPADVQRTLGEAGALIDILGVLQDKTRGNLSEDEERLLEQILYDLRLRFVERKKAGTSRGGEAS
jgi:hypothetical protein